MCKRSGIFPMIIRGHLELVASHVLAWVEPLTSGSGTKGDITPLSSSTPHPSSTPHQKEKNKKWQQKSAIWSKFLDLCTFRNAFWQLNAPQKSGATTHLDADSLLTYFPYPSEKQVLFACKLVEQVSARVGNFPPPSPLSPPPKKKNHHGIWSKH